MNDDIVATARNWLGVPFLHQGRSQAGVDCVGVLMCVAEQLGMDVVRADRTDYSRLPSGDLLVAVLNKHLLAVDFLDARAGDVALFRLVREPQHVGLLTDYVVGGSGGAGFGLLHCTEDIGKVVEHRLDAVWQRRMVGVWRFV